MGETAVLHCELTQNGNRTAAWTESSAIVFHVVSHFIASFNVIARALAYDVTSQVPARASHL